MKSLTASILSTALLLVPMTGAGAGGEIHGTITTNDGRTLTGPVRWDRNENFWDDVLDASKDDAVFVENREPSTFRFLGLRLPSWGDAGTWTSSRFSIPVGHVQALEPLGGDRVRLELKNGESLEVRAGNSDLGSGMRELLVTDADSGVVDLKWESVRRVEFSPGPGTGRDGERLYGTVRTRTGAYTGFVSWDRDESLLDDVLDGDENGREQKIPFRSIRTIERAGSWGSHLTLTDGRTMTLEGSNDVDETNRGIAVRLPEVGTVEVRWSEFVSLALAPAPPSPGYDQFDGGKRLSGRVVTASGETLEGLIRWDRDEEYSWETLDGDSGDVSWAIPFANIRRLTRLTEGSGMVETRNGQQLELSNSNDVNRDNKGIVVTGSSRDAVELNWSDLESVEFFPAQPNAR
jgi:hypothetical protein